MTSRIRRHAATMAELSLIAALTWLYAHPLLDLRADTVPIGREFVSSIHVYHFWTRLRDCGACALWNGSIQGGYPALAELHAGILHPVAAVLVLLLATLGAMWAIYLVWGRGRNPGPAVGASHRTG